MVRKMNNQKITSKENMKVKMGKKGILFLVLFAMIFFVGSIEIGSAYVDCSSDWVGEQECVSGTRVNLGTYSFSACSDACEAYSGFNTTCCEHNYATNACVAATGGKTFTWDYDFSAKSCTWVTPPTYYSDCGTALETNYICSTSTNSELLGIFGGDAACIQACETTDTGFPVTCCYIDYWTDDCYATDATSTSYALDYGSGICELSDGLACSSNAQCQSNNCRLEIDGGGYYCAATGKECSNAGGAGYDTGQSEGSWLCIAQDLSRQCSSSTICDTYVSNYCTNSNTWASGSGTSYTCSTTDHCSGGTYYSNSYCNGGVGTAGACSTSYGVIDDDYSSTSCTCYGGSWGGNPLTDPSGADYFLVKNPTTDCFKVETNGNFGFAGTVHYSQASLSPPANSFILKDAGGNPIFYVDSTCSMYTKGSLSKELSSISYALDNSFYLKRASDSAIFFKVSNTGNVYSIGDTGTAYCSL
jgi:hypothetical protein